MLTDEGFRNKILLELKNLKEGQYLVIEDSMNHFGFPLPLYYTVKNGKLLNILGTTSMKFNKKAIESLNPRNCGRIIIFDNTRKYLEYVRENQLIPNLKNSILNDEPITKYLLEFSKEWSGRLVSPNDLCLLDEESYFIAVAADLTDHYYMYWSPVSNKCKLETSCAYPRTLEKDKFLSPEKAELMIKTVKDTIFDVIMPCRYPEISSI